MASMMRRTLRLTRPAVTWLGLALTTAPWLTGCQAPQSVPVPAAVAHGAARSSPAASESDRADLLREYARTNRFRTGRPRAISFADDGASMFFLRSPDGLGPQELCEYRVAEAEEGLCVTAAQLLDGDHETLTPEERARRERARESGSGITSYAISPDARSLLVPLGGRLFIVSRADGGVRELASTNGSAADARFSPDGAKVACVRGREVFVTDLATGHEWQVTTGADSENLTHGLSEFVAQEEMGRFEGYWWSPDGQHIAYQQTDTSGVGRVYIADAAHNDTAPASFAYPRAGTPNAVVRLGIIGVDGGETRWVGWDREKWEYLATVKWPKDGPLTVVLQNRAQTELSINRVDHATGELTEIFRERDDAWINLDQTMPRWLPGGKEFLWISDREGDLQLELRAGDDGRLLRVLSPPRLTFHGFVGFDDVERGVYVHASRDSVQCQLAAIRLDGGPDAFRFVSRRAGWHTATAAESGAAVHIVEESLAEPYADEIHRRGVDAVRADLSRVRLPAETPRVELCEIGTEPTTYAAIVRPRNFDPTRKYPVIDFAYAGPGHQTTQARAALYYLNQWMADQGYIVVSIDGRGTPNRGRDWERAIKGDLMTRPLADHVAALPLLAQREPAMDLSRVGVFGWSYGGYFAAGAVARAPETYAAAVAGAPVTDWADYDTHYTERFLGVPDKSGEVYPWSSVLAYADRISRPLLVIHGTADDNVHMIHSLKLADRMFRAGRSFEFLPLSGSTHMIVGEEGTVRLYERVMGFFERHLGEPQE